LDNPTQIEGDQGFIGFKSRENPLTLPQGFLQASHNMRLDRGMAQTRAGAKRLADDIALSSAPLTLPATLGTDKTVVSITRSGGTATATVTAHGYTTGDVVNIAGAAQTEYNLDATITVTGLDTFTYAVSGTPTTPATGTIVANSGPIVRTTYAGGVFAAGVYSSPRVENGDEYIVIASSDTAFLWRDGAGLITKTYPVTDVIEANDDVTILQAFDRLYIFRDRNEEAKAVTSLTQTTGTATCTIAGHGYAVDDVVRITGADQAGYLADFLITAKTDDTFTFTVPSGTVSPATATAPLKMYARRVQPPLYWDGLTGTNFVRASIGTHPTGPTYSRLRSSAVVGYFNNQIVQLWEKDSFAVTDILDPDTIDPVLKSFRANVGSNDKGIAIHPFQGGALLAFMRKSIYRAEINIASDGQSFDAASSYIKLMTNEVGCNARRSIVTAGDKVLFLSDNGVYMLQAGLDLNLLGNTQPLSNDIADIFDSVNHNAVHLSNAVFFKNRYWLAIPTTLENGEMAEAPNTLLVYNILNQAWESVDKYSFNLDQLCVSDYGTQRRLYVSSRAGKLFLLDENTNGADDQNEGSGQDVVAGSITTRRFSWGSPTSKRFMRVLSNVVIPENGGVSVSASTYDPDGTHSVGSATNTGADEDFSLKYSVRRKCHYGEVTIASTAGRPVIRSVAAEATLSSTPPNSETRSSY